MRSNRNNISKVMIARITLLLGILAFCTGTARATTIDILLAYDTKAQTWVSSEGGMETFSRHAIDRMNQAMQNSGVELTFRLVHAMSVNYTYSSFNSALADLEQGIGNLASVHSARDAYNADIVAMLVDTGSAYGYVGLGNLLTSWTGEPDRAFSVNAIQSVKQSHTLTHEVGHNFGAHHSKNQTKSPGPNTFLDNQYSAGWYFTGTNNGVTQGYHTIMAYNSDGHGNTYDSAPLFSTPLKVYNGAVAGCPTDGDNARLLREIKYIVARYRSSVGTQPHLNDTGIQFCGEAGSGNNEPCTGGEPQGQDVHYGRDAATRAGTLNKVGGGAAGFDFTKISNSGQDLSPTAQLGSGASDWACTRDNVTGLTWEVKLDDATHFRHKGHRYAWYFINSPDGYNGLVGNTSYCANTLDGQNCNTDNFAAHVNAAALCGFTDWRVPTGKELQTLVHFGQYDPAIDTTYFPNTDGSQYWTASPVSSQRKNARYVVFSTGYSDSGSRTLYSYRVRLVRGAQ